MIPTPDADPPAGQGRRGPAPLNPTVSASMSRMPRADTGPELRLRRELHARGLRFRLKSRLPGRPDIVFTRARLAIFVDGCFWHACPEHGVLPRNNREWWRQKLQRNVDRDKEKDAALRDLGWEPVHIWEHEPVTEAAGRIHGRWRTAIATTGHAPPPPAEHDILEPIEPTQHRRCP